MKITLCMCMFQSENLFLGSL